MKKIKNNLLILFFIFTITSTVQIHSSITTSGAHAYHVVVLEELDDSDNAVQNMHIIVVGKVQGVGFRDTVCRVAEELELKGTVKNLSNGTVEIWADGTRKNLHAFVQRLFVEESSGPWGQAKVENIYSFLSKENGTYSNFQSIK